VILDWVIGLFSKDMGVDLGTANTLVCVTGRDEIISEPSVVAVKKGTNKVLMNGEAVGNRAKEMGEKAPPSIQVIRPLKDGVIADFDITEAMLRYFIRKVHNRHRLFNPRIVIAIPSGITPVEKRAVFNSAQRAGARRVYLIEEPKAAGIGAGLPITEPVGSMIVDIGGGTTEVAVMSLGGVVNASSIRVAGDELDQAIIDYCRRKFNLDIGTRSAERVKLEIGSAYPLDEELHTIVKGRDQGTGLPRAQEISSEDVREALEGPIEAMCEAILHTLNQTPPELAADLVDLGITLTGGGALLRGIDKVIEERTHLSVVIADDPLGCVARGTREVLLHLDKMKSVLESGEDEY
jgi:rod shape-determining protein MreB and related proteins